MTPSSKWPLRKIVGIRLILECGHAERRCWEGTRTKLPKRASRCIDCAHEEAQEI